MNCLYARNTASKRTIRRCTVAKKAKAKSEAEILDPSKGTSQSNDSSEGEKGGDTPPPPKVVPTAQESIMLSYVERQGKLLKQILTDTNADFPIVDPVHGYQMYSDVVKASVDFAISALRPELRDYMIEKTEESAKSASFFDDIFYRTVMPGKKSVIEAFLQILMGDENLKLEVMEVQKNFDFPLPYHSIVSDTYCESADKRIFSIEIQNGKKDESAPRAIFDGHVIGFSSLLRGNNYKNLPPTYIVFLTDEDVPGTGEFIHWELIHGFDPRFQTIFLNCAYAFRRISEEREQTDLLFKLEHEEIDKDDREKIDKRVNVLKDHAADQDKKMKAETDKYGITEKTWRDLLVYGHDLRTKDWHDIQRSDLAELMKVAKEPIAEGVSLMNAVMLKMLEEDREETRLEKDREYAKKFMADNIDMDKIIKYTGLSRDEILKLTP